MIFSRQSMGRPLVAPPGLDPRIVRALRQAFADAMRDPAFIAEGARMDLELNFVSGTDVQTMVERLFSSPAAIVTRAQAIATMN
jgi:tripartite-type tricarboxylate transporter receptor subunit TctC